MTKLTQKQYTVLEYIERYIIEHRRGPFIREIQAECSIASYKSVIDRLNALERKGFIERTPSKHRSIRLVRGMPMSSAVETAAMQPESVAAAVVAQAVS